MSTGSLRRADRTVNSLLLALMIVLGGTGVVMLYGAWLPWLFDLHRIAGFCLFALLPWKGVTVYHSLLRGMEKKFDRSIVLLLSLVFAHLLLLILVLGIVWMWRLGPYARLYQPLIAWHWILGLLALPLLALHAWRRWPQPRRRDFLTRGEFLRFLGVAGAGLVMNGLAGSLAQARATEESPRRFTGSRGFGFFTGNDFPITGEATVALDVERWRLAVGGAVRMPLELAYPELLARTPSRLTEILDCTSGWYSLQEWQGFPLAELLEEAGAGEAAGVRLVSATGYQHSYPIEEARQILLATHVTNEVLAPRHGFPLRAVVPGRRGWFWVKWLAEIQVLDSPWEVAAGILNSPRQVLRQW